MSELIRFNLLDWRGAHRQRRQRQFFSALAGVGLLAVVLFALIPHLYFNNLIDSQKSSNRYIQSQIDVANQKLQQIDRLKEVRHTILNRMDVIKTLQNSRSEIVHYFDQLVATIPDGVHLKSLTQSGNTTTFKGIASANANISSYMSNLSDSTWFMEPRLVVIHHKNENGDSYANFTLRVKSTKPARESGTQDDGSDG